MKEMLIFLLSFFLLTSISAFCGEGQIDINTASLEELDQLSGIGPSKAQAIIDSRPFSSVEDLINVSGIGEVTLNNIIQQGLACVEEQEVPLEDPGKNESDKDELEDIEDIQKENDDLSKEIGDVEEIEEIGILEPQTINLNTQNIKTEESEENNKKNFSGFFLIPFVLLLALLFLLSRKKQKNEFKE